MHDDGILHSNENECVYNSEQIMGELHKCKIEEEKPDTKKKNKTKPVNCV